MLKFYITFEERDRAQKRAAELDVSRSDPPGKRPHVWDNRSGAVNRWYDYASAADKIGTIYFESVLEADGRLDLMVECVTEITHHPLCPSGLSARCGSPSRRSIGSSWSSSSGSCLRAAPGSR